MPDHRVELDYPCSWSFRQFEAWQNGEDLPAIEPPPPTEDVKFFRRRQRINWVPAVEFHSLVLEIAQLKNEKEYLKRRINEHIDASKRKRKGYW